MHFVGISGIKGCLTLFLSDAITSSAKVSSAFCNVKPALLKIRYEIVVRNMILKKKKIKSSLTVRVAETYAKRRSRTRTMTLRRLFIDKIEFPQTFLASDIHDITLYKPQQF